MLSFSALSCWVFKYSSPLSWCFVVPPCLQELLQATPDDLLQTQGLRNGDLLWVLNSQNGLAQVSVDATAHCYGAAPTSLSSSVSSVTHLPPACGGYHGRSLPPPLPPPPPPPQLTQLPEAPAHLLLPLSLPPPACHLWTWTRASEMRQQRIQLRCGAGGEGVVRRAGKGFEWIT